MQTWTFVQTLTGQTAPEVGMACSFALKSKALQSQSRLCGLVINDPWVSTEPKQAQWFVTVCRNGIFHPLTTQYMFVPFSLGPIMCSIQARSNRGANQRGSHLATRKELGVKGPQACDYFAEAGHNPATI